MFGPKNAPAKQMHYLYLPIETDVVEAKILSSIEYLKKQSPKRGVVMIVTEFTGIPMADCFKIVQYWSFEKCSKNPKNTNISIGVAVHFIKYTLLKAQVRDGVKEELTLVAKNWCKFAQVRLGKYSDISGVKKISNFIPEVTTLEAGVDQGPQIISKDVPEAKAIISQPVKNMLSDTKLYFIMLFVLIIFIQYWYNSSLSSRLTSLERYVDNQAIAHKDLVHLFEKLLFNESAENFSFKEIAENMSM